MNYLNNRRQLLRGSSKLTQYVSAIVIVGVTTLLSTPLANTQSYHVVSFILLFVLSLIATFMDIGPVSLVAAISALVWNYFFIPPHYTFHIEKTEDILMFAMFFIIALVNGVLTTKIRRQEQLACEREERANSLFQLSKELSKARGISEVVVIAEQEIDQCFGVTPSFFLNGIKKNHLITSQSRNNNCITEADVFVATKALDDLQKTGNLLENYTLEQYTFYPLQGTRLFIGALRINSAQEFKTTQKTLWDTFLSQISNALERELLNELAQRAMLLDESDRLYKTLFNSISHELRIPVATIMGATDSLINLPTKEPIYAALSGEIFTASLRLNRLIDNLLNMSRLESGHISLRLDWHDVNDLINKVIHDLEEELKLHQLEINIPENIPFIKIDFGLMEQVLYNLLYNASLYAPEGSVIQICFSHAHDNLIIIIADQGPGFPNELMKNVFQKFFRVNGSRPGGLGLGLSIAKGFIEAHSGSISVKNRGNGGAEFIIQLPSKKPEIFKDDTYERE